MDCDKEMRPHLMLEVFDKELGLIGFLVIDRLVEGIAIGGVRMWNGLTLQEVRNLAREMTLKFAYWNIPVGGAKAGIIGKTFSSNDERVRTLNAFGKNLGSLLAKGIYIAGEDMGTSSLDLYHIKKGAGMDIPRPKSQNSIPGYFTALLAFVTSEKLADNLGLKLSGCSVAIEGLGKVGMPTARLFYDAGATIVGVSTIRGGHLQS